MIGCHSTFCILLVVCFTATISAKYGDKINKKEKDWMRKSIVFDKKTPDVFYCPMQKPSTINKLIVRSRPLEKLCEYEGKPLPQDYKSDCYDDVDESVHACKEKYRIMLQKRFTTADTSIHYAPNIENPYHLNGLIN